MGEFASFSINVTENSDAKSGVLASTPAFNNKLWDDSGHSCQSSLFHLLTPHFAEPPQKTTYHKQEANFALHELMCVGANLALLKTVAGTQLACKQSCQCWKRVSLSLSFSVPFSCIQTISTQAKHAFPSLVSRFSMINEPVR